MKSLDQIYRDQKSGKLTESVKKPLKEAYAKKASQVKNPQDFINWLTQILEAEAVLEDALKIMLFSEKGMMLQSRPMDDVMVMISDAYDNASKQLSSSPQQKKAFDRQVSGLLKRFHREWLIDEMEPMGAV